MIREVAKPKFKELFGLTKKPEADFKIHSQLPEELELTGSGKAAISIILQYLIHKKVITSKLDEVLVPDWLGNWVYSQIQAYACPAKRFSQRTKAIFVYHQYGFPQDMVKIMAFAKQHNLVVIEDCAHAIHSSCQRKPVGSFGHFAFYSFSKWFFCFAAGGVKSSFNDFASFAKDRIKDTPFGLTCFKDLIKFIYECSTFSNLKVFKHYANLLIASSYAIYGQALKISRPAKKLIRAKLNNEIQLRQQRYQYFLDQTKHLGICHHLEKQSITPYIIPIYDQKEKLEKLAQELIAQGIQTGLYNFDLNRNLLEPKFIPCLWIPCHSAISQQQFEAIIQLIKKHL